MSIQKTILPKKGVCKVNFVLPEAIINHAKKVAIVGDFNDWHPGKHLMRKNKNGEFARTLELPLGKRYQFRYLIDSSKWESDWDADDLAKAPFAETYNSVVDCQIH
ncbi:MAG: isoamylase early set domain-containing protein [Bacteroidota bacterium]